MTDRIELDDADLFRRYRAEAGVPAPDETALAAFAEGRLAPDAAEAVEAWLASHPGDAEDVAIARTLGALGGAPHDALAERIAARAASLVVADNVVPLRPAVRARLRWTEAASWTALAASVALAGWLGFALGTDAWSQLASSDDGAAGIADVLDPPSGLLGIFAEPTT
jgi:anti-sigma factor RsiW